MVRKIVTMLFCYTLGSSAALALPVSDFNDSDVQAEFALAKNKFFSHFETKKANEEFVGQLKNWIGRKKTVSDTEVLVQFMRSVDSLVKKSTNDEFDIVSLNRFILQQPRDPSVTYTDIALRDAEALLRGDVSRILGHYGIPADLEQKILVSTLEQSLKWLQANKSSLIAYKEHSLRNKDKSELRWILVEGNAIRALEQMEHSGKKFPFPVIEMAGFPVGESSSVIKYFPLASLRYLYGETQGAVYKNEIPNVISGIETDKAFSLFKSWFGDWNFSRMILIENRKEIQLYSLPVIQSLIVENKMILHKIIYENWKPKALEKSSLEALESLSSEFQEEAQNIAFVTPNAIYINNEWKYREKFEKRYLQFKKANLNEEINAKLDTLKDELYRKASELQAELHSQSNNAISSDGTRTDRYLKLINIAAWTTVILQMH